MLFIDAHESLNVMISFIIFGVIFIGPFVALHLVLKYVLRYLNRNKKSSTPPQEWGSAPVSAGEYTRAVFGAAWKDVDGNGRDTRNDMLDRDLVNVTYFPNGDVSSGILFDPYTATQVTYVAGPKSSVQIDHIIPLALAWESGAKYWTLEMREVFANDPLNLLAVSATANMSKGSSGPARWMPPNHNFHHDYLERIAAVVQKYHLSLPLDDREFLYSHLGAEI